MAALAFHHYLGFTRKLLAKLTWMTKLRTEMMAVTSLFIASFSARSWFMSLLTSSLMALQITFMTTS